MTTVETFVVLLAQFDPILTVSRKKTRSRKKIRYLAPKLNYDYHKAANIYFTRKYGYPELTLNIKPTTNPTNKKPINTATRILSHK
jgi:hypothetical protein